MMSRINPTDLALGDVESFIYLQSLSTHIDEFSRLQHYFDLRGTTLIDLTITTKRKSEIINDVNLFQ